MTDILSKISAELMIPRDALKSAVELSHVRCRRIKIPKRDGGYRVASQPAATLKPILAWLNIHVILKLPVSSIAMAFRPRTSILDNANLHKSSLYSVRVDVTGFFPAIKASDLWKVVLRERESLPSWTLEAECLRLIGQACFDSSERLPIGYLTSPAIANAVMYELDNALLNKISDKEKFGNALLSRYAGDFVFSTDKKGACNLFYAELQNLLATTISPRLEINIKKNRFMSRGGGSTLITGLRVNNQGNAVVHKHYRNHIRLLIKLYAENRIKSEDIPKLTGHLAFIEHVDPALFTKLSFKYYEKIAELRGTAKVKNELT